MDEISKLDVENRILVWEVESEKRATEEQTKVNKELTEKLKDFQFTLTKLSQQHVKTS